MGTLPSPRSGGQILPARACQCLTSNHRGVTPSRPCEFLSFPAELCVPPHPSCLRRTSGQVPLRVRCAVKQQQQAPPGRTVELHRACKAGDVRRVEECLAQGVDVDIRDENGSSPLMWAASNQKEAVVKALLAAGAAPGATNIFGWSALEYNLERRGMLWSPSTAQRIRRQLLDAGVERDDKVVPPEVLAGGFARLLHSEPFPNDLEGLLEDAKYMMESAQSTMDDIKEGASCVEVGGVAIAGVSAKRLGLYAGQRYFVKRLFYRRLGPWSEGEERIDVTDVDRCGVNKEECPAEVAANPDQWELCAELKNDNWIPWGSTEVAVGVAKLRSVQSELQWALRLGFLASAFWILVLPAALTVRMSFIPTGSMEPTVHQGDMIAYNPAQETEYARGDIVLLTPPPALTRLAYERGVPIQKGDLLVKRLVGVAGDEVQVSDGMLTVNGAQEPLRIPDDAVCYAPCVKATYNFGPSTVPEGKVFLLGDNRGASTDGHVFGFVDKSSLVGKAFWRVAGPSGFGPLNR